MLPPALRESIGMAAEIVHGSCTDVPPARKRVDGLRMLLTQ